jgi:hypothetical protein
MRNSSRRLWRTEMGPCQARGLPDTVVAAVLVDGVGGALPIRPAFTAQLTRAARLWKPRESANAITKTDHKPPHSRDLYCNPSAASDRSGVKGPAVIFGRLPRLRRPPVAARPRRTQADRVRDLVVLRGEVAPHPRRSPRLTWLEPEVIGSGDGSCSPCLFPTGCYRG